MSKSINPVCWFEIYVENMDRAKSFYEGTFQKKLERLDSPVIQDIELWAFPIEANGEGAAGAIIKAEGKNPAQGSTIVYFSCKDCAVEVARALAHGGRVHTDKTPLGEYGFMAMVYDSEGNLIGLHSKK